MILDAVPVRWQSVANSLRDNKKLEQLSTFLDTELTAGKVVYPPKAQWFAALEHVAPEDVKVVILGQDPYHGEGEAHGLSFSVQAGVRQPPSLKNIWKELARDLNLAIPKHGSLTAWADQGVLLLNTSLTVEADKAASHSKRGWEVLTDALVKEIAEKHSHVVFMLWGAHAQKKGALIDRSRHLVLESVHPSPLSAHRGFFGCGHFSAANLYLQQHGRQPINWAIQ